MSELLEVIYMQVTFDSMVFNASFLDETSAAEWVNRMVSDLLKRYPLTLASRFEIRRTS